MKKEKTEKTKKTKNNKIIKHAVAVTTAGAMVAAIYAACKALEKEKTSR